MRMMYVGHVRVRMRQRRVFVGMGMWFTRRIIRPMGVGVVLVVNMRMGMRHRLVGMCVLVMLAQMQPDARGHQQSGNRELGRQRFAERNHRSGSAKERCR